ncbi:MAG: hypothetical protein WA728_32105 [Xanthobacteraceae bacterium]
MARTSSTNEPLPAGHVRVYKDNVAEEHVIETTKFNHAGSGLEVCRLKFGRAGDARAMLALADLLKAAEPFTSLGKVLDLEKANAEAPLFSNEVLGIEITVGDVQRIMAACAKARPPEIEIPPGARLKRVGPGKRQKPKPPY